MYRQPGERERDGGREEEEEEEEERGREGQLSMIIYGNIDCTHQFDEWQLKKCM